MGIFGALNALLSADATSWKKGFSEARNEVDKTSAKTNGFFEDIKQKFGRRSNLGEVSEILRGGGAVAGLTGAADALKTMAERAGQLKNQFQAGEITAGQMTEELIKQVPVIGQAWQAGRAIRELITGEEAAQRKLNEELEAQAKIMDGIAKRAEKIGKETAAGTARFKEETEKANRDTILQGLDGPAKQLQEAQFAYDDGVKGLREQLRKTVTEDEQGKLQKKLADAQAFKATDPESANRRIAAIAELKDKLAMVKAEAEAEEAMQRDLAAKIQKIKSDALTKGLQEQTKQEDAAAKLQAKASLRAQIDQLEAQKRDLAEAMHGAHVHAVETADTRGQANIVQAQVQTVQTKAAQDAVAQLKTINAQLKTLNDAMRQQDLNAGDDYQTSTL